MSAARYVPNDSFFYSGSILCLQVQHVIDASQYNVENQLLQWWI